MEETPMLEGNASFIGGWRDPNSGIDLCNELFQTPK